MKTVKTYSIAVFLFVSAFCIPTFGDSQQTYDSTMNPDQIPRSSLKVDVMPGQKEMIVVTEKGNHLILPIPPEFHNEPGLKVHEAIFPVFTDPDSGKGIHSGNYMIALVSYNVEGRGQRTDLKAINLHNNNWKQLIEMAPEAQVDPEKSRIWNTKDSGILLIVWTKQFNNFGPRMNLNYIDFGID